MSKFDEVVLAIWLFVLSALLFAFAPQIQVFLGIR